MLPGLIGGHVLSRSNPKDAAVGDCGCLGKALEWRVGHNRRLPDLFPEGLLHHPYWVLSLSASAGALDGP